MPSSDERLAAIDEKLAAVDGKLDRAIIHFETSERRRSSDDDRIAALQKTSDNLSIASRSLANTALRLHGGRPSFWVAVVLASILGGAAASIVTHDALALKPDTALHSSTTEGKSP
jgi:hypothetical protein